MRTIDQEALAGALRALGMLYGAQEDSLAEAARGARDEREAIQAYILRERPHLLASYRIEELVGTVQAAIERRADGHPALEQFVPAR